MTDENAIARCRAIGTEIERHQAAIAALGAERAELLADLDQRHTRRALAAHIGGISGERITQILNTLRWGQPAGGLMGTRRGT